MGEARVELLLIHNEPPCRKCRKAEAVLDDVATTYPGRVAFRSIAVTAPEAASYGPVLPPMILLNGKVVAAGLVPRAAGVRQLVDRELAGED